MKRLSSPRLPSWNKHLARAPPQLNFISVSIPDRSFERDLACYDDFIKNHKAEDEGRYVLIHDARVVDLFDDKTLAYREGLRRFGNTPMLIAKVEPWRESEWASTYDAGLLDAGP